MSTLSFNGLPGNGTRLSAGALAAGLRTYRVVRSVAGTIRAMGVSRSNTEMVSPLRTARRYSLSRAFSSAIPTCLMTIL